MIRGLEASVEKWTRDQSDGTVSKASITGQGWAALAAVGICRSATNGRAL